MAELSDELVAAACAGNPEAVGAIYVALSPKVQGYLRARGVDDAEGLTSEVFLQVLKKLSGLRGGAAALRTFVFSVAHARAVDEIRRKARTPAWSPYEAEYDYRQVESAESAALSGGRDVEQLLGQLNEEQRAVVALRVLGDLSLEQTAAVVGKSTGAVKQLQRRGLLALRTLVESGEVVL
ncbi:MAG: RNA polymerase sigma factor [Nocardioides sp.]